MLGQPSTMLIPEVVGVRLSGALREGSTATDLVLRVTELLRKRGVVGKFVEFFGPGVRALPLADRATIANMAPEYGATCGLFPVDAETLRYLAFTGRPAAQVRLVEAYYRAQGLLGRAQGLLGSDGGPRPSTAISSSSIFRASSRASRGPSARRTAWRSRTSKPTFSIPCRGSWPPRRRRLRRPPRRPRGARSNRPRLGGDRRDHELHEYQQSVGHARRRIVGEEGGREGAPRETVGEDLARARIESRDRLLRARRPHLRPRRPQLPFGGLRLHDLHRQ